MKNIALVGLLTLAANAVATMPFTISGEKIEAIFKSDQLWKKVGGSVETIVFKGNQKKTSTFAITTTETQKIPSPTAPGISIGFKSVPCLLIVQVTEKGDEFTPTWKVTNVDYSACPSVQ